MVIPNRRRTERDLTFGVKTFCVYMLTNRSRVVLYIGITNSLASRVWQHQQREIGGFTKTYKVKRLVYCQAFDNPRDAISREKELRGWRRNKKSALVETLNPKWADFSGTLYQPVRGPAPSARLGMTEGERENVS